jgi:hypothetical protein
VEQLAREESRFVERLAESYAPEAMTPAGQIAFDEALRERIAGRRSSWRPATALWVPAAAAAALAAIWLLGGNPTLEGVPSPEPAIRTEVWEEALFSPEPVDDFEFSDTDGVLPEEYAAIASAFL